MTCTKTITPADAGRMREIIDELPDHAVLCLAEGRYDAEVVVRRSLTLRGQGSVVIDAHGRGTTLWVIRPGITVAVENVTLRRGSGGGVGEGGNISVTKPATVRLTDVTLERGEADANGGGALLVNGGEVFLVRCRMFHNRGGRAQAILAEGQAKVRARDCAITGGPGGAPAITIRDGATMVLDHCLVAGNDGPAVEVDNHAADDRIALLVEGSVLGDPAVVVKAGRVQLAGALLSSPAANIEDGGGNTVHAFTVDADGLVKPSELIQGRGPR